MPISETQNSSDISTETCQFFKVPIIRESCIEMTLKDFVFKTTLLYWLMAINFMKEKPWIKKVAAA